MCVRFKRNTSSKKFVLKLKKVLECCPGKKEKKTEINKCFLASTNPYMSLDRTCNGQLMII